MQAALARAVSARTEVESSFGCARSATKHQSRPPLDARARRSRGVIYRSVPTHREVPSLLLGSLWDFGRALNRWTLKCEKTGLSTLRGTFTLATFPRRQPSRALGKFKVCYGFLPGSLLLACWCSPLSHARDLSWPSSHHDPTKRHTGRKSQVVLRRYFYNI